jgi:hypothetical protein
MKWEKVDIKDLRRGMKLAWTPGGDIVPDTNVVLVLEDIRLEDGQEPYLLMTGGTRWLIYGQFWQQVEEPEREDGVYHVIDQDNDSCIYTRHMGVWYEAGGYTRSEPKKVIAKIPTEPV